MCHFHLSIDLGLALGQAQEPRPEKFVQHPINAIGCFGFGIEIDPQRAVASHFQPFAGTHQLEQDAFGRHLLFGNEGAVKRVGSLGQRLPPAAQLLVGLPSHPVAVAALPQLQQRKLQQWQGRRFAQNVVEQSVHHARLEPQANAGRGRFNRLAQFACRQRRHPPHRSLKPLLKFRQSAHQRFKVRPHRQNDSMPGLGVDQRHQSIHKCPPLLVVVAQRERLFKLIHDEDMGRDPSVLQDPKGLRDL